jgi:hypothetical protein
MELVAYAERRSQEKGMKRLVSNKPLNDSPQDYTNIPFNIIILNIIIPLGIEITLPQCAQLREGPFGIDVVGKVAYVRTEICHTRNVAIGLRVTPGPFLSEHATAAFNSPLLLTLGDT